MKTKISEFSLKLKKISLNIASAKSKNLIIQIILILLLLKIEIPILTLNTNITWKVKKHQEATGSMENKSMNSKNKTITDKEAKRSIQSMKLTNLI